MKKLAFLLLFPSFICQAELTLRNGQLVETKPSLRLEKQSVQEQFERMMQAYERKEWKNLEREAIVIIKNFSGSSFAREATYFLGVAYFYQEELEMANFQLTDYLTHQVTPKYFEEAIQYKFSIAEKFRLGARKHLMGFKTMPKWLPSGAEALAIYDEVISALPHHDLAAHALYGKSLVLSKGDDYRATVEAYQTLIRRFPKHPLSVESYIGIGIAYLSQSKAEYPDPDLLDLAELNLRKFQTSFPSEERIQVARDTYFQMQEYYANNLFETARFYERTNKWGAAKIYYAKILASYPHSSIAKKSQDRLTIVENKLARVKAKSIKK